jgi:transposase
VTDADARIVELEARLAEFSAALGRERVERERAAHERDQYKKLYELVAIELERVKRHLRAQNKSERVDAQQVQLAFAEVAKLVVPPEIAQAIADEENAEQEKKAERTADAPRGRHGRGAIPEHVPTERIEVDVPEPLRTCACCGKAKVKIGEETSDRLDYRPASLVHVRIARIKYAPSCKCEDGGIVVASVPDAAPVDRGLAGSGLLAHVVVSKYGDHLPLNRLEEIFDRQGVHIARSTMCDWVEQVASLLRPITDAMAKAALSAHRIHTDDTGIPILAPGSTHKGHVWVYVADDDSVLFRYTARRKSDGPREFLRGYTGYVQADAANLYDRLFGDAEGADGEAKEVGCWAHARRRFFDAQVTDRERALIGLGFIKKLYEVDRVVLKMPPSRRTAERQRLCAPVLDTFKAWLDAEALVVLPKAPIADAIGYARNQWGALTRFLDDARLKLDNNAAERQLRRVAVGRKNWLFAGSENGAETACVLYSLLATCKLHGVNPFDYLRDVIMRVGRHPARDVLELTPKPWKQKLQNLDASRSAPTA